MGQSKEEMERTAEEADCKGWDCPRYGDAFSSATKPINNLVSVVKTNTLIVQVLIAKNVNERQFR